ncbi:homeobox-leucine zipper protein HOX21-like [Punica granatum]|uniref:Homeobox-leucine zipper protein HOX21-like n=2 Tax=Punica granatum TaxID=22663 RepID=A0A6P8EHI4_PUNGR|nr:homeobox-leucine zipper protein HOX21-like [Punica granatum]XP_031404886.1 homeobox-leucine zipper protein HOX21-like [Punica granatum]PKI76749.1 hypothetical protein CRG98_002735 [Punica granatum]
MSNPYWICPSPLLFCPRVEYGKSVSSIAAMDASLKQSHHHHHPHHNHHHPRHSHCHHHCHFVCQRGHRHFICHHRAHSPALAAAPLPPALQHPDAVAAVIQPRGLNSETFQSGEPQRDESLATQMSQEQEHNEQIGEDYDDYDEEPVFVLTDEWKEFFAKSEAKRKQDKKRAKKKGNL